MTNHNTNQWGRAALTSLACALALSLTMPVALAQAPVSKTEAIEFSVPAGPLGQSLIAVANTYGVNVVGPDTLVAGKSSPAVSGTLTAQEALAVLLDGSGLEAMPTSSGSYVISQSDAQAVRQTTGRGQVDAGGDVDEDDARELDNIIVRGRARSLYRVLETDTGKLANDPLDTTQIITTINEALIRDQGAREATDLYRNIAGVTDFQYDQVQARGFRQVEGTLFDGLRGDPYASLNIPQLFGIERVDFLKGPAAMLFGQGEPGGVFNYVTKKPSQEFSADVRGVIGTDARVGGSFEVTAALPVEGTAGRLGAFVERRDLPRTNADSDIAIYDAGFSTALPFASVILQATHYEQDLGGARLLGVPADDEGNFLTDPRWNHNEETDFQTLEATKLQAIVDSDITDDISWNMTVRYLETSDSQEYHNIRQIFDTDNDGVFDLAGREFRNFEDDEEEISLATSLTWQSSLGVVDNRLMVGYEYFESDLFSQTNGNRFSNDFVTRFLNGTSLDSDVLPLSLDNPQYGLTQPEHYIEDDFPPLLGEEKRDGAYLLNEAIIGKFALVGGVRFDRVEGRQTFDTFVVSDTEDDDVNFRLGGRYKPTDNVAFFAQWANTYTPQSSSSRDPRRGGPFDPTTSTIVEGGVKARLMDGRFFTSFSVYDIVRENVLQNSFEDPGDDGFDDFVAIGEVTSTGVEVEFTGDLTPDWVLTAAYAYNDVRITADNGGGGFLNSVGNRFINAPEHQFGFWTRYQIPSINTAFGVGGDYVSERVNFSGQTVKSYFVADASIIWDNGHFEVLVRANNLFDEEYAVSGGSAATGNFPGAPRSVFLEVSRKW